MISTRSVASISARELAQRQVEPEAVVAVEQDAAARSRPGLPGGPQARDEVVDLEARHLGQLGLERVSGRRVLSIDSACSGCRSFMSSRRSSMVRNSCATWRSATATMTDGQPRGIAVVVEERGDRDGRRPASRAPRSPPPPAVVRRRSRARRRYAGPRPCRCRAAARPPRPARRRSGSAPPPRGRRAATATRATPSEWTHDAVGQLCLVEQAPGGGAVGNGHGPMLAAAAARVHRRASALQPASVRTWTDRPSVTTSTSPSRSVRNTAVSDGRRVSQGSPARDGRTRCPRPTEMTATAGCVAAKKRRRRRRRRAVVPDLQQVDRPAASRARSAPPPPAPRRRRSAARGTRRGGGAARPIRC